MTQPVDGADATPDEETPEADAAADERIGTVAGGPDWGPSSSSSRRPS